MPLTVRQTAFLDKLFDVYHAHREQPIHYTELARALGVANSTAYQVLKSLQVKGYVSSEYHLADNRVGPGRSTVLFRPTMKALRRFRHLLGEDARRREWDFVKTRLLERLAAQGSPDDTGLLADLLAAIPESEDPLSYCGRVLAASLVSIRSQLWGRIQESGLFKDMTNGDNLSQDALDLLPGFALGLSWASEHEPSWLGRLADSAKKYQGYLHELDEAARVRLLRFSREVMVALQFPWRSN